MLNYFKCLKEISAASFKLLIIIIILTLLCKLLGYACAFYLKGCETALKEAPPAAARETLHSVATKLESTAQCGTVPVPLINGPPKISKSWLIRRAAQYLGKMKEAVGEKREPMNSQLPTSLAAFTNSTIKSWKRNY